MDIHQSIELRLGGLGDECIVAMAGIIDQVIKGIAIERRLERGAQALGETGKVSDVAGVQLERHSLAAHRLDLRNDSESVFCTALIGHDDVAALPGNVERRIAAKAAAATGDESDFVRSDSHGTTPCEQ